MWQSHKQIPAVLACTAVAFVLIGYHPYVEDGGIYSAAITARLDPALFPHDRAFVTAHTRFALFVPLAAMLIRSTHLSPEAILLLLHLAGLGALIAAGVHLARTCFPARPAWTAAVSLALGAGLPVAGTSLYAVDPYCTARTLTSPVLLFTLSYALRNRWQPTALLWLVAATLHPLMALWSAPLLLLVLVQRLRSPTPWLAAIIVILLFAVPLLAMHAAPETALTRQAAATRAYWFPSAWRWYEWLGAAAPPLLLQWFARTCAPSEALRRCAQACALATLFSILMALLFVHEAGSSLFIARLQPMRTLHPIFLALLALIAPWLSCTIKSWRAAALVFSASLIAAFSVTVMQRSLFPHTRHIEWPGVPSENAWQDALRWCAAHTPSDALYALPADYINLPGEDSHGFRAVAHRSSLPDYVKDAGVAAVLPALTPAWAHAVQVTRDLSQASDGERRERLRPDGVTWLLLPASAHTALHCPFHNTAAQVCQLQ